METLKDILNSGKYGVYGLRVDTINYSVGNDCYNSHQWLQDDPDDGTPYNENEGMWDAGELDGTCALRVTADSIGAMLKRIEMYGNGNIYLIGGDYCTEGWDDYEVVIRDAKVLAQIQ